MQMRQWLLGAALVLLAATATAQDRTKLQVNSVFGDTELGEFKKLFEADNPDIEIVWDRASTGGLGPRLRDTGRIVRILPGNPLHGDLPEQRGVVLVGLAAGGEVHQATGRWSRPISCGQPTTARASSPSGRGATAAKRRQRTEAR
jgi:hypothetical protein